ncbi:hypothetical protein SDC9_45903 [bioreactor metagenome]|uniref:Uncharacterized protein n=1 Tax=bioreactor metagenome TaxID=1076179 RepID=A0A644WBB8_9ZZZZ
MGRVEGEAMYDYPALGDCGGITDSLPHMTGPLCGCIDVQDITFHLHADTGEGVASVVRAAVAVGALQHGKVGIAGDALKRPEMVGVRSRLDDRGRAFLSRGQLVGDVDLPCLELYRFAVVAEQCQNRLLMVAYGRRGEQRCGRVEGADPVRAGDVPGGHQDEVCIQFGEGNFLDPAGIDRGGDDQSMKRRHPACRWFFLCHAPSLSRLRKIPCTNHQSNERNPNHGLQ